MKKMIYLAIGLLLMIPTLFLLGCSTVGHQQTSVDPAYSEALIRTAPENLSSPEPGTPEATAMLERVTNLFTNYTAENLEANLTHVYADELYLRDAFKTFSRSADIKHYLLEGLKGLRRCTFEFTDISESNGEYYLRWTMIVSLNRDPEDSVTQSLGMTHMRFNKEGKVVFHQDYWDPSDVVYTRIPIANRLITFVKNKM